MARTSAATSRRRATASAVQRLRKQGDEKQHQEKPQRPITAPCGWALASSSHLPRFKVRAELLRVGPERNARGPVPPPQRRADRGLLLAALRRSALALTSESAVNRKSDRDDDHSDDHPMFNRQATHVSVPLLFCAPNDPRPIQHGVGSNWTEFKSSTRTAVSGATVFGNRALTGKPLRHALQRPTKDIFIAAEDPSQLTSD